MARIICIASGKGGVGKTTSVVNLGKALNDFGYNTVLVDGNIDTPNLGIYLGMPNSSVNLKQVLVSKKNIFESVYLHPNGSKLIPTDLNIWNLDKISKNNLREVQKLKKAYDIVLLDCPPGINADAEACIKASDEVIVVTNPNMLSVTDALKTITLARSLGKPVTGTIINRMEGKNYDLSKGNISEFLGVPIITVVPEDRNIKRSLRKQGTVIDFYPKSKASESFRRAAANLMGIKYKPSLWKRLKKGF